MARLGDSKPKMRVSARRRAEIERELSAEKQLRQFGDPSHGQQEIDENAEQVVEECEGPSRNVSVRFFQMDLVRFTAHGGPVV